MQRPVETLPSGRIAAERAGTGFTALLSKVPVARQAMAAARAPYTRFAVALPTPRVAPGSVFSGPRRQRALRITPAAWEAEMDTGL